VLTAVGISLESRLDRRYNIFGENSNKKVSDIPKQEAQHDYRRDALGRSNEAT